MPGRSLTDQQILDTLSQTPFVDSAELAGIFGELVRPRLEHIPPAPQQVRQSYLRLSLRDVQLSFAGYRSPSHPIHKSIAGLSAGDPLNVKTDRSPWEVETPGGITVGRVGASICATPGNRPCVGDRAGHRPLEQGEVGNDIPWPTKDQ